MLPGGPGRRVERSSEDPGDLTAPLQDGVLAQENWIPNASYANLALSPLFSEIPPSNSTIVL